MNSKNYRDIVLEYVQKLGEIDRTEDELFYFKEKGKSKEVNKTEKQLTELKKEASDLKNKLKIAKRKNK